MDGFCSGCPVCNVYLTFVRSIKKLCSLLRMLAHVAACVGNAGHGSLISATKLFIFHHGHEQKPPPRPLQRWNQFTRESRSNGQWS